MDRDALIDLSRSVATKFQASGGDLESAANFHMTDREDEVLHVDMYKNPPEITAAAATADVDFHMTADVYDKLLRGEIDPMKSYLSGKFKAKGKWSHIVKWANMLTSLKKT